MLPVPSWPPVSRPSPADEMVDVVDDDDHVVATVTRREMRARRLQHRAVFVAVIHPDGQRLLVHRRSDLKDVWPGWWDLAVGGVVAAGESDDQAVRREVAEELGVAGAVELLGGGRYVDDTVAVIGRCYRLEHPGPFTFADGEVVEAEWLDRSGLHAALTSRSFLPDSVALVLPLLPEFARP